MNGTTVVPAKRPMPIRGTGIVLPATFATTSTTSGVVRTVASTFVPEPTMVGETEAPRICGAPTGAAAIWAEGEGAAAPPDGNDVVFSSGTPTEPVTGTAGATAATVGAGGATRDGFAAIELPGEGTATGSGPTLPEPGGSSGPSADAEEPGAVVALGAAELVSWGGAGAAGA
jgi:hypothetical protein